MSWLKFSSLGRDKNTCSGHLGIGLGEAVGPPMRSGVLGAWMPDQAPHTEHTECTETALRGKANT